jgi:drug/metabolite transporter (DMT)-like permease
VKHYVVLFVGMVGAASSVFFIKASGLSPASLGAGRLLLSALILLPFAWPALRKLRSPADVLLVALPASFPLALHYMTWFVGVRQTTAVLSTLTVNLVPVLMPFLVWALLRERINRGEVIGSLIAITGIGVLALGKDPSGESTTYGILVCVISISLCALYLALGRKFGRGRPILVYIVPLYAVSGLFCLAGAFVLQEPLPVVTTRETLILLGAVIFPTVIGHTALNHAMVHLPSQVVSISNLGQVVVVAILAMPIRGEYPTWALVPPAALVLAGALVVIWSATPKVREKIALASTEPAGT